MLVRDELGRYETIDFRETAPAAASRDMYAHNRSASVLGGLAVGVPGELKGLEYLHRKYGVSAVLFQSAEHPSRSANRCLLSRCHGNQSLCRLRVLPGKGSGVRKKITMREGLSANITIVNEDLVRYMASASVDDGFLVNDPVWAQDFAPNGMLSPSVTTKSSRNLTHL